MTRYHTTPEGNTPFTAEEETAREAFRLAAAKLPVKTTFVQK